MRLLVLFHPAPSPVLLDSLHTARLMVLFLPVNAPALPSAVTANSGLADPGKKTARRSAFRQSLHGHAYIRPNDANVKQWGHEDHLGRCILNHGGSGRFEIFTLSFLGYSCSNGIPRNAKQSRMPTLVGSDGRRRRWTDSDSI